MVTEIVDLVLYNPLLAGSQAFRSQMGANGATTMAGPGRVGSGPYKPLPAGSQALLDKGNQWDTKMAGPGKVGLRPSAFVPLADGY